jgi:hypothetical protein
VSKPSLKTLLLPWSEVFRIMFQPLLTVADRPLWRIFLPLLLSLLVVWFITVPVHELLHVAGCLLTGGEVSELTIQPMYGGVLLAKMFSFVTPGGGYAGQLTGFDTGGSDVCYFVTVWFPFLLTVLLGVSCLTLAAGTGRSFVHGIGIVHTFLPVASITGDFYEMGSILATRLLGLPVDSRAADLIRGDDLMLVISRVREAGPDYGLLTVGLGLIISIGLITLTVDLSILTARLVTRKHLEK